MVKRSQTKPQRQRTNQADGHSLAERSAGVVLFRDSAAGRLFLLLDYGRHWDYPKGHVERGEDDLAAARRELYEETGISDAQFMPGFSHEISYHLRHAKRGKIRKTVNFFLARTTSEIVLLSDEHVGCAWLSGDAALLRVTYANARQVLTAALEHLTRTLASQATDQPA